MATYNLKVVDLACKFKDNSVYESFINDYEEGILGNILSTLYTEYKLETNKLDSDTLNNMVEALNQMEQRNRELQKQNLQLMKALSEINKNVNSLGDSVELVNHNVTKVGKDIGHKLAMTASLGDKLTAGSSTGGSDDEMEKELQALMGQLPEGDLMIEAPIESKVEDNMPKVDMAVATFSKKSKGKSRFGLRR